jgi:hypothetical protein
MNYTERNVDSHAFDDYEVSWNDERDNISKLHVLRHESLTDVTAVTTAAATSAAPAKPDAKKVTNFLCPSCIRSSIDLIYSTDDLISKREQK